MEMKTRQLRRASRPKPFRKRHPCAVPAYSTMNPKKAFAFAGLSTVNSCLRSPLLTSIFKKIGNLMAGASEAGHLNPKKRQRSPLTWDSYILNHLYNPRIPGQQRS